jgi:hypothetical protein
MAALMRVDVEGDMVDGAGRGGDQRALDHLVWRLLQQDAVLEGAGLVLVAVADQDLAGDIALPSDRSPFSSIPD